MKVLSEKLVHDILGAEGEATYTNGEGCFVHTIDVWELLQAQHLDTLRQVVEMLDGIDRQQAKKFLCGGCTGTRMSGSYFSTECKDDAPRCRRITDFLWAIQTIKNKLEAMKE